MWRDRLNYIFGAAGAILLIVVLWYFSNPMRTQRVQAGFLGVISPFLWHDTHWLPGLFGAWCVCSWIVAARGPFGEPGL